MVPTHARIKHSHLWSRQKVKEGKKMSDITTAKNILEALKPRIRRGTHTPIELCDGVDAALSRMTRNKKEYKEIPGFILEVLNETRTLKGNGLLRIPPPPEMTPDFVQEMMDYLEVNPPTEGKEAERFCSFVVKAREAWNTGRFSRGMAYGLWKIFYVQSDVIENPNKEGGKSRTSPK